MAKLVCLAILSVVGVNVVAAGDDMRAGQESLGIKALSNQEIEGYLKGSGMGYARAAELNDFPGPRHVLDLSHELHLTGQQIKQTRKIYNAMKKAAAHFGAQLIEKERELDRIFADENIDERTLDELITEISVLEGKLRGIHLRAHLEQRELLNERQVLRYAELRGYNDGRRSRENHGH